MFNPSFIGLVIFSIIALYMMLFTKQPRHRQVTLAASVLILTHLYSQMFIPEYYYYGPKSEYFMFF